MRVPFNQLQDRKGIPRSWITAAKKVHNHWRVWARTGWSNKFENKLMRQRRESIPEPRHQRFKTRRTVRCREVFWEPTQVFAKLHKIFLKCNLGAEKRSRSEMAGDEKILSENKKFKQSSKSSQTEKITFMPHAILCGWYSVHSLWLYVLHPAGFMLYVSPANKFVPRCCISMVKNVGSGLTIPTMMEMEHLQPAHIGFSICSALQSGNPVRPSCKATEPLLQTTSAVIRMSHWLTTSVRSHHDSTWLVSSFFFRSHYPQPADRIADNSAENRNVSVTGVHWQSFCRYWWTCGC